MLFTFTVITVNAHPKFAHIHDRMPVSVCVCVYMPTCVHLLLMSVSALSCRSGGRM